MQYLCRDGDKALWLNERMSKCRKCIAQFGTIQSKTFTNMNVFYESKMAERNHFTYNVLMEFISVYHFLSKSFI